MWELDCKEGWASKIWCFWTVVLEKTLESPFSGRRLNQSILKEISWIFIERTDAEAQASTLGPPDVKNWLIGKDPDAGKHWRQEEKGMIEDEVAGWHHWLKGHESEQALLVMDRAVWRSTVHGVAKSKTRLSDWTKLNWSVVSQIENHKYLMMSVTCRI